MAKDREMRKTALMVAVASSFITPFMGSGVNIALPSLARDLRMDAVLLSWVATSYILASVISLVPFGRLADIYGRKKIFLYGYIIFSISTLFCGLANSPFTMILARVIQGIGSAMFFATGAAILISVYPPQERGKVLGIAVAAVYIGLSIGPFLGGFLTEHLSWRGIFFVNVPLGVIPIFLARYGLKGEWREAEGEKFDLPGSLIYGLGILAFTYGITLLPSLNSLWVIFLGFIGILGFIKWEGMTESPVFDLKLFRTNRVFLFSSLAALINYSATFAISFLLSLYLQHIKAMTPQAAGLVLVSQPVVQAVFSPFAGRLSDRVEPRVVASLGMAITTLGLVLFIFLAQGSSLHFILGTLMVLGLGFALFASPNTNAIMSSVERRYYGLASGSIGTTRQLGMMISMGIATFMFSMNIGRVEITPSNYPALLQSIRSSFAIFSILCFAGIFFSLVRGRIRHEQAPLTDSPRPPK
ncbi:MAG: MFS transporter [Deltaproteobacteria bacterium]|nr:MFS transporter [Deltaproteobacteria bacterium]